MTIWVTIVAALAGSGVALPGGAPTHGAEVVAGIAVVVIARWHRDLLLAILAGVVSVAVLRTAGL